MFTLRRITTSGDRTSTRDESFATKRAMFDTIAREQYSAIRRIPGGPGKCYAINMKSK